MAEPAPEVLSQISRPSAIRHYAFDRTGLQVTVPLDTPTGDSFCFRVRLRVRVGLVRVAAVPNVFAQRFPGLEFLMPSVG